MLHCGRRRSLLLEGGLTAPEARGGDKLPNRKRRPTPANAHTVRAQSISTWRQMALERRSRSSQSLDRRKSPPRRAHHPSTLTTRFRYRRSAFVNTSSGARRSESAFRRKYKYQITRRSLWRRHLGRRGGDAHAPSVEWPKAWAQASAPMDHRKRRGLSILRWQFSGQSEDDSFVAVIDAFTKATGVNVTISR